jgi:hypothetical protein
MDKNIYNIINNSTGKSIGFILKYSDPKGGYNNPKLKMILLNFLRWYLHTIVL